MENKRAVALFVIVSLLLFSQEKDFNLMGSGARALGMGGAFIGLADDATSIGWNPAGLGQLIKPEVSFSSGFKFEDWSSDYSNYSNSHFSIDFGSFVFPIGISNANFVMAVAYRSLLEPYYESSDTIYSADTTYIYSRVTSGAYGAISPAIALNVGPLYAGGSFDIWMKGPVYKWDYNFSYSGGSLIGTYSEMNKPSAFGLNLGALIVAGTDLKAGAILRLPVTIKENVEVNDKWSGTGVYTMGDTSYTLKGDTTKFPMMIGFGISAQLGNNLTVAFDYEFRPYSKMEINGVTYPDYYHNCNQLRFGLEYMLPLGVMVIPLRAGFMTDPKTYEDLTGNQVIGKMFTGGTGLIIGNFSFDFSLMYGFSKETWATAYDQGTDTKINAIFSTIWHF